MSLLMEVIAEIWQCKGRFLAKYAMKLWLIMLLEMYDLTSDITSVPKMDPRSWNTVADPVSDITIALHRREAVEL